jgi:hypothetical protein
MVLGSGIIDQGSGKNPFRIPDPGDKKAPDPGSATLPVIFGGAYRKLKQMVMRCRKESEL